MTRRKVPAGTEKIYTNKRAQRIARCDGIALYNGPDNGPCRAREGELHRYGCDHERCTQCSGQYLYCDCPEPREKRKRVPFIRLGWSRCARCGVSWPERFDVPNDVWRFYVLALGEGDQFLCVDCFGVIADLIDGSAYAREHGGAVMVADIDPDAPEGSPGRARWEEQERKRRQWQEALAEGRARAKGETPEERVARERELGREMDRAIWGV